MSLVKSYSWTRKFWSSKRFSTSKMTKSYKNVSEQVKSIIRIQKIAKVMVWWSVSFHGAVLQNFTSVNRRLKSMPDSTLIIILEPILKSLRFWALNVSRLIFYEDWSASNQDFDRIGTQVFLHPHGSVEVIKWISCLKLCLKKKRCDFEYKYSIVGINQ